MPTKKKKKKKKTIFAHHPQKVCVTVEQMGRRGEQCRPWAHGIWKAHRRLHSSTHPRCDGSDEALAADPGGGGHLYRHPQHPALRKTAGFRLEQGKQCFVRVLLSLFTRSRRSSCTVWRRKSTFSHGAKQDIKWNSGCHITAPSIPKMFGAHGSAGW